MNFDVFHPPTEIAKTLQQRKMDELLSRAYAHSYPLLCLAAQRLWAGDHDAACLAGLFHLAYGWMPTILEVQEDWKGALEPLEILLNSEQRPDTQTLLANIRNLQKYSQNNTVGLSKVLHFVRPDRYPIWDSNLSWVTRVSTAQKNSQYVFVSKAENYIAYIEAMDFWLKDKAISKWLDENTPAGLTQYRALEFALFLSSDTKI